jgi:lipoyl(octanoyl) transferase
VNHKINKEVNFIHLGTIDYQEAWDFQEKLFAETLELKTSNRKTVSPEEEKVTPNYLIFCQHPHVYTLGKSGSENNLLINEAFLQHKGATFYKINRGGDITYHGPGQVVGYPIIDLKPDRCDVHRYVRDLEEVLIRTAADFGILGTRVNGLTGVWVGRDKLAAIGVRISRWVTSHGFALNVSTDLNYFDLIVPCGIADRGATSIAKLIGRPVSLTEVEDRLIDHFASIFDRTPGAAS